jgi:hypothetical protein
MPLDSLPELTPSAAARPLRKSPGARPSGGRDLLGNLTKARYDGRPRNPRPIPRYVRLTPPQIAAKITALIRYVEEHGRQAPPEFEAQLTASVIQAAKPTADTLPDPSTNEPGPAPQPVPALGKGMTAAPSLDPSKIGPPVVDMEGAELRPKTDRPLLKLRDGWLMATDYELQWQVYHRRGKRWVAITFPTIVSVCSVRSVNVPPTDTTPTTASIPRPSHRSRRGQIISKAGTAHRSTIPKHESEPSALMAQCVHNLTRANASSEAHFLRKEVRRA